MDNRLCATHEEFVRHIAALTERMNRYEETAPKTEENAAVMSGARQLCTFIQMLPLHTLLQIKPHVLEEEQRGARCHR